MLGWKILLGIVPCDPRSEMIPSSRIGFLEFWNVKAGAKFFPKTFDRILSAGMTPRTKTIRRLVWGRIIFRRLSDRIEAMTEPAPVRQ